MPICAAHTPLPVNSSRVWPELPSELADRIINHLQPNEVACNFRLFNRAAALRLLGPQHTTIRLSQPVPPNAFARHWLAPGATRGLTLQQRRKLQSLTAASGNVPNLEVAVRAADCLPTQEVFEAAAAAGSLEACQWLHQQGYPLGREGPTRGEQVLTAAVRGGHMHVCEWLLTLDVLWDWGAEEAAAEGGHVALMEWLIQRRPQLRYIWQPTGMAQRIMLAAAVARGCNLPTLQRLWLHWGELSDEGKAGALSAAAGSPTPDWAAKVEWLEGQGCPRTEAAAKEAAAQPDEDALARLTWLRRRGYPLGDGAYTAAALAGNAHAIRFLSTERVRPTVFFRMVAAWDAAHGGHLPALQALHVAGLLDPSESYRSAVRFGRLHVVAWLVETLGEEAVRLDARALAAAAESGSVELMAWLRQRGCDWDAEAIERAAEGGCEEALEWLVERGCPMPEDGRAYLSACRNGDLATARCLQRLGVPWGDPNELTSDVVKFARPPMLRWLLEARCPVDFAAVEAKLASFLKHARFAEALAFIQQHLQQQQGQGRELHQQHGERSQRATS